MPRITTQKKLRAEFWREHPELSRKKVKDYSGNGTMFVTDTRVAFCNWLDALSKNGDVTQEFAAKATLS